MNFPDLTNPEWFSECMSSLEISSELLTGAAIGLIVLGIVNCFFGYPIFRILLGIFAGIAGAGTSFSFAYAAFGNDLPSSIIVAVTAGVISTIIFVKLYYLGVFLIGAGLVSFLAITALNIFGISQIPLIIVLSGLVGGLIALMLQKLLIILATSIFGALYAVFGVAQLAGFGFDPDKLREDPVSIINWREPDARLIIMVSCWVVAAVIGIIVQFKIASAIRARKEVAADKSSRPKPSQDEEDY